MAEDIAEVRIGLEHLLVEECGDSNTMLGKNGDCGCDEFALLWGERRRMREAVARLDDFGHVVVGARRMCKL